MTIIRNLTTWILVNCPRSSRLSQGFNYCLSQRFSSRSVTCLIDSSSPSSKPSSHLLETYTWKQPPVTPLESHQSSLTSSSTVIHHPSSSTINHPSSTISPMLQQYLSIKHQYPEFIILFQVGEFYELFYEDAHIASLTLGIALTRRVGDCGKGGVPMAGVPVHTVDSYIKRLLKAGHLVAIVDQVEDTETVRHRLKRQRGGTTGRVSPRITTGDTIGDDDSLSPPPSPPPSSSRLIMRQVTRLLTPGTLIEEKYLTSKHNNYLLSIVSHEHEDEMTSMAWIDASTGELGVTSASLSHITEQLSRLNPTEILCESSNTKILSMIRQWVDPGQCRVTLCPSLTTSHSTTILQQCHALSQHPTITSIIDACSTQLQALAIIIKYMERTQGKHGGHDISSSSSSLIISSLTASLSLSHQTVSIDLNTRRALELFTSFGTGDMRGSLFQTIDWCMTAQGSRLLYSRLSTPIRNIDIINERLDSIFYFMTNNTKNNIHNSTIASHASPLRSLIRSHLQSIHDIHRCLQRLMLRRGSPVDLYSLAVSCREATVIAEILQSHIQSINNSTTISSSSSPFFLIKLINGLLGKPHYDYITHVLHALTPSPPLSLNDGDVIRPGYSTELDTLRRYVYDTKQVIHSVQSSYRHLTSIPSLKIRYNNIFGYFIEIDHKYNDVILKFPQFYHIQSVKSGGRYKSQELNILENKIKNATTESKKLEISIYIQLLNNLKNYYDTILQTAVSVSEIDVACSMGELAATHGWTRPVITSEGCVLLTDARHPVVELKQRHHGIFTPNDCYLSREELIIQNHIPIRPCQVSLLTGANMGGKSTYIRQVGILAVLALSGFPVPASHAVIGTVDRIFARVGGTYDNLSADQSTFFVEMSDIARICHSATRDSLVLVDEYGSATSSRDALAIGWALLEYLYLRQCLTLFSTHHLDLVKLSSRFPKLKLFTTEVKMTDDNSIIIDHQSSMASLIDSSFTSPLITFTHKIIPGVPQGSYGIHCGRMAGLPLSVVARAIDVLGKDLS